MFKKLLVDNPAVLVTFAVHYGLTKEHVQDIEVIINPDTVPTGYEVVKYRYALYIHRANVFSMRIRNIEIPRRSFFTK